MNNVRWVSGSERIDAEKYLYVVIGKRYQMSEDVRDVFKASRFFEDAPVIAWCSNREAAEYLASIRHGKVFFNVTPGAKEPILEALGSMSGIGPQPLARLV